MARCAQLFIGFVFVLLAVSCLLQAKDMDLDFFLPIMENGWRPMPRRRCGWCRFRSGDGAVGRYGAQHVGV
ncbi:MAG TPA: hypothetical protein VFV52_01145 [Bacilli bacterium]|nr:hypothetical protein [Bacilli bacterium]